MRSAALFPAVTIAALAMVPAACSRENASDREPGRDAAAPADPAAWAALSGFTGIEVTGPDNVIVTRGDFSVKAEGDAKILDRLDIRVKGDTLEIGRRKRFGIAWSDDRGATVRVSLPAIRNVEATGSGNVDVDRVDGDTFAADLTGSGNIKVSAANLRSLKAEITVSGNLDMAGATENVALSITGSGDFSGNALKAGRGKVSIQGSGNAGFASDGPVDINIMGSGDVTVRGKAQCKQSIMGSGEARCAP